MTRAPQTRDLVAALEAAIAFLTNADDAGFGTQRMEGYLFHQKAHELCERLRAAIAAEPEPQPVTMWQDIASAPKDGASVIIAVPTKDRDDHIVGEAYFDPQSSEDGEWWWAGTSAHEYATSSITDGNHHQPSHWQPLPASPLSLGEAK